MSPTDWFIELEGDNTDIERLAQAFTEPPVMAVRSAWASATRARQRAS